MPSALRRACWLAFLLLVAPLVHAQTNFTSIVVFGDSLSDTGNVANLTQAATLGQIRYPSDIPALGFDYTDGRFTDGPDTQPAARAYQGVWVEQLAASFAGKPAVKDALDGGTNYAYADATTANTSTTLTEDQLSITIHNMGLQVADYLGTSPAPVPNASTLYVLWGGANDLYGAASAGGDPIAAAATAVANELALVQQLANAGATNFMLPNLPPLGGVPEYATSAGAMALNTAAGAFAQELAQGIASLKTAFAAQGKTITFYQPDIFTAFSAAATNPMAVGLGNVSSIAQNITGSPDTYLIWDGLHPTTTGHHYVAGAAVDSFSTRAASSVALSAPATVVAGTSVTFTAKVASGAAATTAVPTGLVTFFNGTVAFGSAALDATGTGTFVYTGATAASGPYNLTAIYAGDTTYKNSPSAVQTLAVLASAVATTTTLTTSNANPGTAASVTLTATVTPAVATYGTPAGTVTFSNGATALGTGTLTNGVATLASTTLPAGTDSITASYAANGVFGASTSAALTETVVMPGFTPSATPTSLTIADGASGTTTLSAASVGGYDGTVTLACGTLPAHLSCAFSATTLTLGSTAASPVTLTIATNASAALAQPERPGVRSVPAVLSATLLFPGFATLAFFGLRRRRDAFASLRLTAVLVLLAAGAAVGLTGCGSSSQNAARGTYTVPVTFTPSTGTAQTLTINVVVQ